MTLLATYWAKSAPGPGRSGESLTSHLEATFQGARELARRIGTIAPLDVVAFPSFWRVVELAAITHDTGKVADGFQRMVKGQTRIWGQRHEVLSIGFVAHLVDDLPQREWVALIVATHHRQLFGSPENEGKPSLSTLYEDLSADGLAEELGTAEPAAVTELLDWIARTAGVATTPSAPTIRSIMDAVHEGLGGLLERWRGPVPHEVGLHAVLLQGAVTLADHLSSAHGILDPNQPVHLSFRDELLARLSRDGRTVREHQTRSAAVEGHLILRAPTGSGKTESGLLWAASNMEQIGRQRGCVPRLFYTLPYLASINAMADRLGALIGDPERVGVAHSRAGSYHLASAIEPEDGDGPHAGAARKAVARAAATRLFRETVRVGTPYQLLRGALAGPIHSSVLLDTANSVFLLDELHAYDTRRLGFILSAMKIWEELGGRLGILSATLPEALIALVRDTLTNDVEVVDGHRQSTVTRHRIRLREHHVTDQAGVEEIHERLLRGESVLVVANNVAHAQNLFADLAPTAEQLHGHEGAHLLHARFTRRDRNAIEHAIRSRYRASGSRQGGLLVATQTVEVSLDLDFDAMHTSAAPLEALLQRFGRVNRLGTRRPADVVVHQPSYGQSRRGEGEFADGIYPAGPTRHGWQILARHENQPINERMTVDWLNEVYGSDWGAAWRTDVEGHRDRFTIDFLTFTHPFEDRDGLEEQFDALFDGTEAVLLDDIGAYRSALDLAPGGAGRLLAEDLLIPLPHYARPRFDRQLRVGIIDADYEPRTGLGALRNATTPTYLAGEIL